MKKYLFVIFIVISTICILSSCLFDDGHYDGIYREVETDIKVSAKYAIKFSHPNSLDFFNPNSRFLIKSGALTKKTSDKQ